MTVTARPQGLLGIAIFAAVLSTSPHGSVATAAEQIAKLSAADAAANDGFGWSVSISDNVAAVGARGKNAALGAVYLYDVSTGNQISKLTGDATDIAGFGHSVAIAGNSLLVGAPLESAHYGSVYLFDVTSGNQRAKLIAEDAGGFGSSVALSGGSAIVGAPTSHNVVEYTGSAYVYDVTTGNQVAKLTASDGATFDHFGESVSISGNTAIVGAYLDDDAGNDSGSAYLFDATTGEQLRKLLPSDGVADDKFGTSVAVSGNIAIVGAPYVDNEWNFSAGAAYLFDVTTGAQLAKLTVSDIGVERLGISVAICGDLAVVGADFDYAVGAAYVFRITTDQQIAKLVGTDLSLFGLFGAAVSISDGNVVAGAPLEDDAGADSGAAYLFHVVPEPTTPVLVLMAICGLVMGFRTRR